MLFNIEKLTCHAQKLFININEKIFFLHQKKKIKISQFFQTKQLRFTLKIRFNQKRHQQIKVILKKYKTCYKR